MKRIGHARDNVSLSALMFTCTTHNTYRKACTFTALSQLLHHLCRYNNRFYVFANAAALDAFVAEPMFHVRGVAVAARHSPELIHLLRIQVHTKLVQAVLLAIQHPVCAV